MLLYLHSKFTHMKTSSSPFTTPLPPLSPEEQRQLRSGLQEAGCRFTKQREAVYTFLSSVHTHPTAEDVFHAVRGTLPNISLATVYKSLEALVDSKLALKLNFGDGHSRYDSRTDCHFHLHCTRTGQVRDVPLTPDASLLEKLSPDLIDKLREMGFEVTDYRLELLGHFTQATVQQM
jgi:Fur family transcriptional regulator, peroxide stress response regulator